MRTLGLWTVVPLVAACRFGFPEQQPTDAVNPDAAPDAAPPTVLSCGTQTQFALGAPPQRMSAATTAEGYNVVTVDDTGKLSGFSYGFASNKLTALHSDVAVPGGTTGSLGALALGDHTLLSVPQAGGTQLITLDANLKTLGTPATHEDWQAGGAALAQTGTGAIAFLRQNMGTKEVEARLIMADGTPTSVTRMVTDGSDKPSLPTLVPAGDNLLVVWDTVVASPHEVHVSVLGVAGGQLTATVNNMVVSPNTMADFDADNPRGAYSAELDTYLFAWMMKQGADPIWATLRRGDMGPLGSPFQLGTRGNFPVVAAGDKDFLVAWKDDTKLFAARVTPEGTVTSVDVPNAIKVGGWDVVVRAGQPALVWIEADTSGGSTLWFDPACAP